MTWRAGRLLDRVHVPGIEAALGPSLHDVAHGLTLGVRTVTVPARDRRGTADSEQVSCLLCRELLAQRRDRDSLPAPHSPDDVGEQVTEFRRQPLRPVTSGDLDQPGLPQRRSATPTLLSRVGNTVVSRDMTTSQDASMLTNNRGCRDGAVPHQHSRANQDRPEATFTA